LCVCAHHQTPHTQINSNNDASNPEVFSLLKERLTSDRIFIRFYRIHDVPLLQRRKERE
jgi:hypothetical protein